MTHIHLCVSLLGHHRLGVMAWHQTGEDQWWLIDNWSNRSKLQRNLHQSRHIFFKKKCFSKCHLLIATILFRPRCFNWNNHQCNWCSIVRTFKIYGCNSACLMRAATTTMVMRLNTLTHDDVIRWKHFPRYWHFTRGIHRSPKLLKLTRIGIQKCISLPASSVNQRPVTRSFDVSLTCAWTNGSANNWGASDLRRHCAHCDVSVMNKTHNESCMAWCCSPTNCWINSRIAGN